MSKELFAKTLEGIGNMTHLTSNDCFSTGLDCIFPIKYICSRLLHRTVGLIEVVLMLQCLLTRCDYVAVYGCIPAHSFLSERCSPDQLFNQLLYSDC
jgi:hypothetical protein